MEQPVATIKGRYLLLWLFAATILSVIGLAAADRPIEVDPSPSRSPSADAAFMLLNYGLLLLFTGVHARWAGVGLRETCGATAASRESFRVALIALPMIGVAFLSTYIVFAPLSLVWPDAVHAWLFEGLPVFYSAGPPYPLVANLLGLASMAVVAPVIEEWFFRGLLLRRWSQKWGPAGGVIGSSVVFGVLHVDVLGAILFGIAMCGLYAHYRSLWPAVIVHIANNATVAGVLIVDAHGLIDVDLASVEQLRNAWWMAAFGLAVAVPWLLRVRRSWVPISTWRFGSPRGAGPLET